MLPLAFHILKRSLQYPIVTLALASVTMGSMAQDAATTEKYSVATNSFWSNWLDWLIHTESDRPMILEVLTDIETDNQVIDEYYNSFQI